MDARANLKLNSLAVSNDSLPCPSPGPQASWTPHSLRSSGFTSSHEHAAMNDRNHREFVDYYASIASHYTDSRPHYPPQLFAWLASQCPRLERCWDCGTGTGQAATGLAAHFQQVDATDASMAQIVEARQMSNIHYRKGMAEACDLPDSSVDLVTAAQALHWFDIDVFHAEARRVLKPDGLLAVWTYGTLSIEGEQINSRMQHFYHQVIAPWWPPGREHVENGYRDLPFPFRRVPTPRFTMQQAWSLMQLLDYLRSWSACVRYRKVKGEDPIALLEAELAPLWGDAQQRRLVSWPLFLHAGRP